MNIKYLVKGKTLVIKIVGELDHHSADYLRQKLDDEIMAKMPKGVIFDFSNVNFMDSSGIGVLMGRYKNIEKIDGRAAVVCMTPQVKKVFEMSGLGKIISVYDDIDQAVAAM